MKFNFSIVFFIFIVTACSPVYRSNLQNPSDYYSTSNANKKYENTKVEELLEQMSLPEKVGQMAQVTLDVITQGKDKYSSYEPVMLDTVLLQNVLFKYHVGSILNTANNRARTREQWYQIISQIQQAKYKGRSLTIPVLYGVDAIHGTTYTAGATFFPQQIGMAATFNPSLIEQVGQITAYEMRASNIPWNFSPVLDMGRDPRFPRMWETFGEDVYLTSVMGNALLQGYQGLDSENISTQNVAACLKHFLGYGTSYSGKDRTPAYIPENQLREIHLQPFQKAIEAGAQSIMINSGIINGKPVHANKKILTDILRNELGFKGVAITDWADIENLYKRDKVASSEKEAVEIAINAGIDMAMIPYNYEAFCTNLIELVQEKKVSVERINEAVRRILQLKLDLGLFNQSVFSISDYPEFGSEKFSQIAYRTALESITLLKNKNNLLPLTKTSKYLVVGPNANSMRSLNGGWSYSWQGEKTQEFSEKYHTLYQAMVQQVGKENVMYSDVLTFNENGKYDEEIRKDFQEVIKIAQNVDYILLCVGENSYTEKPGDLNDLHLSKNQVELALELSKTGKPIILILNEGRPRLIYEIEPLTQAILNIYLPANFGADALTDILFGKENPSGKLPYTYPKAPNSLITYDYKPSENQEKMSGVYDYESTQDIQFPFGFGLSYTTFSYSNLQLNTTELKGNNSLQISVIVSNTGKFEGKEVVMLFTKDHYASLTPDNKRLRKFQKINLKPGESQTLQFTLSAQDLAFVNADNEWVTEDGTFSVLIQNLEQTFNYNHQ